jgi:hypothetical protein
MAKRNVVTLNINPAAFTVVGISSHENDYRLSWSLNEHLGLAFAQTAGLITDTGEEFTCFAHEDEIRTLLLISNRCDNGFLLEKYKNFDFMMKFDSELTDAELSAWLRDFKKVPLISIAFPIPLNKQVLRKLG